MLYLQKIAEDVLRGGLVEEVNLINNRNIGWFVGNMQLCNVFRWVQSNPSVQNDQNYYEEYAVFAIDKLSALQRGRKKEKESQRLDEY